MKKTLWKGIVVMLLTIAWAVVPAAAQKQAGMSEKEFEKAHEADMRAQKAGTIFVMSGKVSAVDLNYSTAVIECPVNGQTFTVGGPLAPKAQLKMGEKTAGLGDFSEGTPVTVKWKATEKGPVILMIQAK
jgi:hypothetical protein